MYIYIYIYVYICIYTYLYIYCFSPLFCFILFCLVRKCKLNGNPDVLKACLENSVEARACNEHACECVLRKDALPKEIDSTKIDWLGWIEKDGKPGWSSEKESVFINDAIEEGVVIHMNCNNW